MGIIFWDNTFKVLKGENYQPRIVHLTKQHTPSKIRKKLRHAQKNKLGEFITTRPVPQEMLKGVLPDEMKG